MTGRAGWGVGEIRSRHKAKASTVAGQQVTTGKARRNPMQPVNGSFPALYLAGLFELAHCAGCDPEIWLTR